MTATATPRAEETAAAALSDQEVERTGAVVAAVTLVSSVPLLLLGLSVDRIWVAGLAAACGLVVAPRLRGRQHEGLRASAAEVVLGAVHAAYLTSLAIALWLGVYWLLRGVLALVGLIPSVDDLSELIAWGVSLVIMGPVTLVWAATAGVTMQRALYPAAGLHSEYYEQVMFHRRSLIVRAAVTGAVLGLAAVLSALFLSTSTAAIVVLCSLVVLLAAFVRSFLTREPGRPQPGTSDEELTRSLDDAGWAVVQNPRTGNAGVDPFLAQVDVFASKNERSVLIEVCAPSVRDGPDQAALSVWLSATGVLTAAQALPFSELPPGVMSVDPVLLTIDAPVGEAVRELAHRQGIALLEVDTPAQRVAVDGPAGLRDELDAIGRQLLAAARLRA